jgi:hypothetical protein
MNIHNLTLSEQLNKAQNTDNTLALAIADTLQAELQETTETTIDVLKEAYLDRLSEKLDEISEQWQKDHDKGGCEYDALVECFDHAVSEECIYNIESFERHVLSAIELHSGKPAIADDTFNAIKAFDDKQWAQLAQLAASDIETSFDDETIYALSSNQGIFYFVFHGETEHEVSFLELNLPFIAVELDKKPLITDDELNQCSSSLHFSGEYVYLDMSDQGIAWRVNLEWLEETVNAMLEEGE